MNLELIKTIKAYFLLPKFKKYKEDLFEGGREVFYFEANTGFIFRKGNDERKSWFEFTILGFGIGLSWGDEDDSFFK